MAKKRKTRAEKERAARRQAEAKPQPSPAVSETTPKQKPSENIVEDATNSTDAAGGDLAINNREDMVRHRERMSRMRLSMLVFAGLVGAQVALWAFEAAGVLTFDWVSL